MTNTVLVTGGAGYIGSHTCKALFLAGYKPVTLDNLVYGHKWAVKWGPFVHGDISDADILDRIFAEYAPKAVVHFAAFTYVGESVKNPAKYYQNNVSGTIALLNAMERHGCKNIIFSSSCATYGMPETMPISEGHPQNPATPYGWSKLMIERILKDFDNAYSMKHAVLRYFNAAGADPDMQTGEDHNPETHLIPTVIQTVLGHRKYFEVYGTDYPTPDGTAIRDYIHVTDLADAHVLALNFILESGKSICLNLGTGCGHSVLDIINAVGNITGDAIKFKKAGRRNGDPPVLVAKADTARLVLGWKPEFTRLESIIESSWNWHLTHHKYASKNKR